MSVLPRIRRATYDPNEVFRTDRAIPVIASLRWHDGENWGEPRDTEAVVTAWTLTAVEIEWTDNQETFVDWIDAEDIRRQ
jgi:hypothetical protein